MMLLGIYLHAGVAYSEYGSWPWKDGTTTGLFDVSLGLIHVFRMPVFYVLAGFFAALLYARRGAGGFVRNRVIRILVPFAVGWAVLFPVVKVLVVLAASVATLLGSYHVLVRPTWIGAILNGRKVPIRHRPVPMLSAGARTENVAERTQP
jgi:uncharacterized membrane protein YcfT